MAGFPDTIQNIKIRWWDNMIPGYTKKAFIKLAAPTQPNTIMEASQQGLNWKNTPEYNRRMAEAHSWNYLSKQQQAQQEAADKAKQERLQRDASRRNNIMNNANKDVAAQNRDIGYTTMNSGEFTGMFPGAESSGMPVMPDLASASHGADVAVKSTAHALGAFGAGVRQGVAAAPNIPIGMATDVNNSTLNDSINASYRNNYNNSEYHKDTVNIINDPNVSDAAKKSVANAYTNDAVTRFSSPNVSDDGKRDSTWVMNQAMQQQAANANISPTLGADLPSLGEASHTHSLPANYAPDRNAAIARHSKVENEVINPYRQAAKPMQESAKRFKDNVNQYYWNAGSGLSETTAEIYNKAGISTPYYLATKPLFKLFGNTAKGVYKSVAPSVDKVYKASIGPTIRNAANKVQGAVNKITSSHSNVLPKAVATGNRMVKTYEKGRKILNTFNTADSMFAGGENRQYVPKSLNHLDPGRTILNNALGYVNADAVGTGRKFDLIGKPFQLMTKRR